MLLSGEASSLQEPRTLQHSNKYSLVFFLLVCLGLGFGFFFPSVWFDVFFFFLLLCFFAFPIVCAGSLLNSIKNVLNVIFLQVCFSRHPLGPVGLALAWFESWQIHSDFALGPLTRQMGLTSKETCVFCHLVCCNASLH